jgi:hypothetical protein
MPVCRFGTRNRSRIGSRRGRAAIGRTAPAIGFIDLILLH